MWTIRTRWRTRADRVRCRLLVGREDREGLSKVFLAALRKAKRFRPLGDSQWIGRERGLRKGISERPYQAALTGDFLGRYDPLRK